MSIRFTCSACRTVLKLGEMIAEPRKVRCTGCGIVIMVEPDPEDPLAVTASIPEQGDKTKKRLQAEQARMRMILLGSLAAVAIALALGLWWTLRTPSDRGSIEGEVKLDSELLENGTIIFVPVDPAKEGDYTASAPIHNGKYTIPVLPHGPAVGMNKVKIHSKQLTGGKVAKPGEPGETIDEEVDVVASRFNSAETELEFDVQRGPNTKDFEVKRK